MKIRLEINNKPFKETILFNFLYMMLVIVRVLMIGLILYAPMLISLIVFKILGVKNVFGKWVELFEGLSFFGDKP